MIRAALPTSSHLNRNLSINRRSTLLHIGWCDWSSGHLVSTAIKCRLCWVNVCKNHSPRSLQSLQSCENNGVDDENKTLCWLSRQPLVEILIFWFSWQVISAFVLLPADVVSLLFCLLCLPEKRQNLLAQRALQKMVDGATLFYTNFLVGYALGWKRSL